MKMKMFADDICHQPAFEFLIDFNVPLQRREEFVIDDGQSPLEDEWIRVIVIINEKLKILLGKSRNRHYSWVLSIAFAQHFSVVQSSRDL